MNQDHQTLASASQPTYGVFAVICRATGEVWVGCSDGLGAHRDRLWADLRRGAGPQPALQAAWTQHGEPAFTFEELDRLRDDFPEAGRLDELKKRQTLWRIRLEATAL